MSARSGADTASKCSTSCCDMWCSRSRRRDKADLKVRLYTVKRKPLRRQTDAHPFILLRARLQRASPEGAQDSSFFMIRESAQDEATAGNRKRLETVSRCDQ